MSLREELINSPKMEFKSSIALRKISDEAASTMTLSIIFRTAAAMPSAPIDGVQIKSNISGSIYTAKATLQGMKNLVDNDNVISVGGFGDAYIHPKV